MTDHDLRIARVGIAGSWLLTVIVVAVRSRRRRAAVIEAPDGSGEPKSQSPRHDTGQAQFAAGFLCAQMGRFDGAAMHFEAAIKLGHGTTATAFGTLLLHGSGNVCADPDGAIRLLAHAADACDNVAATNLGHPYER